MKKAVWLILVAWVVLGHGFASAQTLTQKPKATGGNPVGIWEADKTSLQVYLPPVLLQVISGLSFDGSVSGRLTLEATGGFQADYIVTAKVQGSVLAFSMNIDEDVVDTSRTEGSYQVLNDTILVMVQNTVPVLRDTMRFSVVGDSLRLIQGVPIPQEYAAILSALSGSDPPLAVVSMGKVGDPTGPIGPITADFNENGLVDFPDFLMFVVHYGARIGDVGYEAKYDLNDNGDIGFADFLEFAQQFGHES